MEYLWFTVVAAVLTILPGAWISFGLPFKTLSWPIRLALGVYSVASGVGSAAAGVETAAGGFRSGFTPNPIAQPAEPVLGHPHALSISETSVIQIPWFCLCYCSWCLS